LLAMDTLKPEHYFICAGTNLYAERENVEAVMKLMRSGPKKSRHYPLGKIFNFVHIIKLTK
jgi:hypothetical protein